MTRNWRPAAIPAATGAVLVTMALLTHSPTQAVVYAVIFALLTLVTSPLAFPRSVSAAQAQRVGASEGRPIIYWRPGCPFCVRLRFRLGRRYRRAQWVNIWADPEGAAAVRAVTGGDETVPTVVAGSEALVNPDPARVRELLALR